MQALLLAINHQVKVARWYKELRLQRAQEVSRLLKAKKAFPFRKACINQLNLPNHIGTDDAWFNLITRILL
jgi:hypothetical protein